MESQPKKDTPIAFQRRRSKWGAREPADVAAFAVRGSSEMGPCSRGPGRLGPGFSRGSSEWRNQEPAEGGRNHESKRNHEIIPKTPRPEVHNHEILF